MTHLEDLKRIKGTLTEENQEYLYRRIEALENRVAFLEAKLEVSKQK